MTRVLITSDHKPPEKVSIKTKVLDGRNLPPELEVCSDCGWTIDPSSIWPCLCYIDDSDLEEARVELGRKKAKSYSNY